MHHNNSCTSVLIPLEMFATLSERISALGYDKSSKHVDYHPFISVAINHVRLTIPINSHEDHRGIRGNKDRRGATGSDRRFEEHFAAPRSISANRVASNERQNEIATAVILRTKRNGKRK